MSALCWLKPSLGARMPLLATGSADRTLRIWDPQKGTLAEPASLVQTLYRHTGTVTAIASIQGYILSGSTDCKIHLWRATAKRTALLYPTHEHVRVLATMPAWVTCMTAAPESLHDDGDNDMFVADSDANVIRIAVANGCASHMPTCGWTPALRWSCAVVWSSA